MVFEKLKEYWEQFFRQTEVLYKSSGKGGKLALFAILGFIILAVFAAAIYKPALNYEIAFSNLSAEDKSAIMASLKKATIKDFKLEGDSLFFPDEKMMDYKMILAQEGLPSTGNGAGWEKFDDHTFGMSDFDQKVTKVRAIQGELARTINKLDPVENSRVHIVIPENSFFNADKKVPTASIYLRLKSGKSISERQIQGIVHLVSHAVEGLDPKDVALVDQQGNMLTQMEENDGGLDKVTSIQREYQRKVEKELELKIAEILTRVVGFNKVVSKVQATIDFKKVEETISDVDPDRVAVISSQRNEQSTQGAGLNPTGVPGAKSNLPGEKEENIQGGLTNSTKSNTENLNYEVKKVVSKIIEPVGSTIKLNASVLVDGKSIEGKYIPRSKEEMEMITKLVKNAIGFQDGRDSLTVENAQFEPDEIALSEKAAMTTRRNSLIHSVLLAVTAVVGMTFVYFGLLRPYFRWLTFTPQKQNHQDSAASSMVQYEFEKPSAVPKRMQVNEDVPFEMLSHREQILFLAKNDPKKTTEALRQLLTPF